MRMPASHSQFKGKTLGMECFHSPHRPKAHTQKGVMVCRQLFLGETQASLLVSTRSEFSTKSSGTSFLSDFQIIVRSLFLFFLGLPNPLGSPQHFCRQVIKSR